MASAVWLTALLVSGLCKFYFFVCEENVLCPRGDKFSVMLAWSLSSSGYLLLQRFEGAVKAVKLPGSRFSQRQETSGIRVHAAILCHLISGQHGQQKETIYKHNLGQLQRSEYWRGCINHALSPSWD